MREEIEDDDELYLVEEDGEKQLYGYSDCSFESNVRVPLLEILKFPYLLVDKRVGKYFFRKNINIKNVSEDQELLPTSLRKRIGQLSASQNNKTCLHN